MTQCYGTLCAFVSALSALKGPACKQYARSWCRMRLGEAGCGARQVLDMRERALGPEHPEVASALNNLAVLLRAVDKVARPAHPLSMPVARMPVRPLQRLQPHREAHT